MYKPLVKNIIFPTIEFLYGRNTLRNVWELEKTQWLKPEELKKLQLVKLRKLIGHAYENVPFYKRRFDKLGILPSNIRKFDDIKKIPFLTKEDVRLNLSGMIANKYLRNSRLISTSGSTGIPLRLYMDKRRRAYDLACMIRFHKWWGLDIADKQAILCGWPHEFVVPPIKKILFNRIYLSAFELSEDNMRLFYRRLFRFRPKTIFGYAFSIYTFAKFLKENNFDTRPLNIKLVITCADVLFDHIQELISDVFACSVANHYGARDGGNIAHECPYGNMHINSENVLVEPVDSELVITHLENFVMPFIRYKIGDKGALSEETCKCGRGLPILKSLEGRTSDMIVTPSGKKVHSLSLAYIMKNFKGVRQFKIIQEDKNKLLIKLRKENDTTQIDTQSISEKIKKMIGEELDISFEISSEALQDNSRKLRYVTSYIK